jgi:hypothetical protein
MKRQIYEVYAKVIDASGAYNTLSNYPKVFDSRTYNNDIDKTLMRATGEFASTWGAMCLREDRQLQMVLLMTADGFVIDKKVIGQIADLPDEE